ncbi:AraC family transcriptional regulator [Flaviaesturariibacter flavus]|uniref:AraC family transcriptional regulator n=1 Tax=Flaviaesturariibacter flavus TaxID=2502780 RepID=A0A4R1B7R1_9BACT|nr:AraC family transcriptional regulator [Flaviaesturariibacter flavus]TCJ13157.1 AraC family transcriptional regulator [Flaviaesturariibacter flavus]
MDIRTAAPGLRPQALTRQYLQALDQHMGELRAGDAQHALEIRDFAALLHVHPTHLSNTIKEVTGRSTCAHYEERLLALAKELLADTARSIGDVARQLTYDPSNFTKFFKAFAGMTPKEWRKRTLAG